MRGYYGMGENKLNHSLGVARECYRLAKEKHGMDETEAKQMFLLGFIHDIGYEFAGDAGRHPIEGHGILSSLDERMLTDIAQAVLRHGNPRMLRSNACDIILNTADLTTEVNGMRITPEERLAGIKARYGEDSAQYADSVECCRILRLLP